MHDANCLFCKILQGEIPSKKVFESEKTYAFLDIFPVSPGHTVIVPKDHYYNILDMPEKDIAGFFLDLKKIAQLLKEKLHLDGFNILQNNFPAGGQVIPHCHYHIIPRMQNDGKMKLQTAKTQATNEELDHISNQIGA